MTNKWIFVMVLTSTLWTICHTQNGCTGTIVNASQIVFTCLPNAAISELPLYSYTTSQLANITSIEVNGMNSLTPGPFTSIPPNLCLLPNLQYVDFSFNQITQVDPSAALSSCLSSAITLDLSHNNVSQFPSFMIYHMPQLENLYFHHNQLIEVPSNAFPNVSNLQIVDFSYNSLTTFDLWALFVNVSANFTHNQISTITNKYFFTIPMVTSSSAKPILLNNNNPTINLTDAIYEMYNSCSEVIEQLQLPGATGSIVFPTITLNLLFMNFGTTLINCSCNQAYILEMFQQSLGQISELAKYPIGNATCTDGRQFLNSACAPISGVDSPNSTIDFTQVYPRFCEILQSEGGSLTSVQNISMPTSNASTYPHYETRLMSPGACSFTFSSSTAARIKCTTDLSSASAIPTSLLSSTYFSTITTIDFGMSISSLPSYLCSLPSRQIDLSYQSFTILSDATFPCLDWFYKVTLSHNNITSVNMTSGNFTNLNYLDLSSNRLTTLPYSILTPTPSSLRYLDLRNNSITSIDLFLYTLKNITVDLRDNPINSSSIINPQNVTLPLGNSTSPTVNITLPSSVTNSTYIFNDQTALTAGACNRATVLEILSFLQMAYNTILLDCSCASINLKEIFLRGGANILSTFNCSNAANAATFTDLTMSSCMSVAVNFTAGLCYNESLQKSMDETRMGALIININIHITNNSLTTLINSSILSNITENQRYTSSPESEETGLDLYTQPTTTNHSNQLTPVYLETKNSSHPNMTSESPTNNSSSSDSMATLLPINVPDTGSLSSTLPMMNSTAMMSEDQITISLGWTTTTTTTTTTTSTSSTTSTSTSTTSKTTSTTSTSTSTTTTSRTTSTTSTSTSTTSRTTTTSSTSSTSATSTSTSTSTTSRTTSTTSTSTSTTSQTSSTSSTSTSTTSQTTSTSSTSTSTTSQTTSTTSTSTSTSSTSQTTSTSSTSTSTTSRTTSSTSTSTSITTAVAGTTAVALQSSNGGGSGSSNTGLIVGLVVGLVGFFAIVGALVAVYVFKRSKGAGGAGKSIGRAVAISQAPQHALLEPRLKTRNPRAVRLAPLSAKPSQLPSHSHGSVAPVTVVTNPSNSRASTRGIPLRLDHVRSPSNVLPEYAPSSFTANDSFHFQSMSNPPSNGHAPTQPEIQKPQPRRPRSNQILNTGGDTRY